MKQSMIAGLAALVITVSGCSSITKEESGALIGAVAGGLLGSTIGDGSGRDLAIVTGTMAGAIIGSQVGKSMDQYDRLQAQHALEHSRTGEQTQWINPDDPNKRVEFTPTRTYSSASGQYCREYQTTITVAGKPEQAYGTACRQADGSWKIIN